MKNCITKLLPYPCLFADFGVVLKRIREQHIIKTYITGYLSPEHAIIDNIDSGIELV